MAGYSGTSLSQKLGIEPGARVALVRAPEASSARSIRCPMVRVCGTKRAVNTMSCCSSRRGLAELERRFDTLARAIGSDGGLWIAWPKRTAGVATDLRESIVREVGLAHGLVDNKVCAVDDTWSGLRFVVPRSSIDPTRNGRALTRKRARDVLARV